MVGRFLEHARILCFGAGHKLPSTESKVFLSSADWMPRNLHRRVETLVPIENETVKRQLVEQVLMANRFDVMQSWEMQPDGAYRRLSEDPQGFSAHTWFMTNPSLSGRGSALRDSRPAMPGELFPESLTAGPRQQPPAGSPAAGTSCPQEKNAPSDSRPPTLVKTAV